MTVLFDVLEPGPNSQYQDTGRQGFTDQGITSSGAMDDNACYWANRLCNNPQESTVLEITLGGLKLRARIDCMIAVTGSTTKVTLNGRQQLQWATIQVCAGDELDIGFSKAGIRAYLAVAGGLKAPEFFNSRATCMREGLGQPLRAGDTLNAASLPSAPIPLKALSPRSIPLHQSAAELRVIPGPHWQALAEQEQRRFLTGCFTVSPQSDRMGIRLGGQPIAYHGAGIRSEGLNTGTIQLPPSGDPILMMKDHQTIGGYPKIASVIEVDWPKAAQLAPGNQVSFSMISMEEAVALLRQRHIERKETQLCQLVAS